MKFEVFKTKEEISLAKEIILSQRLHSRTNSRFSSTKEWIRTNRPIKCIVLSSLEDQYTGSLILLDEIKKSSWNVGVYVITKFRRQGIGTKLLQIAAETKHTIIPAYVRSNQKQFYKSCGIKQFYRFGCFETHLENGKIQYDWAGSWNKD